jgi:membrane-bound lytic murein transglycosylase F
MTKFKQILVVLIALQLVSCQKQEKSKGANEDDLYNSVVANAVDRDLDRIAEDGVLRALVVYSSTSYFLYRGQAMGFEYEILERLADHLNLKLEIIISDDLDAQFDVLNRGDVDLIANGMTITNQRKAEVSFTEYLYLTRQVLVQKKPDNHLQMSWKTLENRLIHDPIELINDTISIRKNSAYHERLISLSNEMGGNIAIDTLNSELSTAEIMDMVADGTIKYTIADENLANINASNNSILNIDVPISLSQRIAWVTRKKSKNFREVINKWIKTERKKTDYRVIYNKYFKNRRSFKRRIRSDYYSLTNNQISEYDGFIKTYANSIDMDWRLLASQVYQESRFDPSAESWAGASGLMQVMPGTADDLGIKNLSDPEESLRGGTTYLNQMYSYFDEVPDPLDRMKLAMASFNCGYGHVQDAQRLATAQGLDPMVWDGNVESMLLALRLPKHYNKDFIKHGYVRGSEPVNYIQQIFERYQHYMQFISLEAS